VPVETGRIIKRKRIRLPGGGTVDVPVITQITFLDVVDQGQEAQFSIENTGVAKRDVHTASVLGGGNTDETGAGGSNSDTSQTLQVERLDLWRVLDIVSKGQETFFVPDSKNIKQPPDAPPYFATHEQTHIVKYINTPDDGHWIKSELVDKWKFLDVVDQGQETEFFLFNPPDNQNINGLTLGTDSDGKPTVAVDPNLTDISDSGNGVDPPWRLDPFQNIIDFSALLYLEVKLSWTDWNVSSVPGYLWTIPSDLQINFAATIEGATLISDTTVSSNYGYGQVGTGSPPPDGWTSDSTSTEYIRTLVFKIGSVPGGGPISIGATVSGADRYTNQAPLSGAIVSYTGVASGPYPFLDMALYASNPLDTGRPASMYHMAIHAPTVGVTSFIQTYFPVDSAIPPSPPAGQSAVAIPSIGNGEFTIQVGNIQQSDQGAPEFAAWVEVPVITAIDNVVNPAANPGSANEAALQTYMLGVYSAGGASWLDSGLFKFGGPPNSSNAYTGPFPPT
jgi:hypothetical protein